MSDTVLDGLNIHTFDGTCYVPCIEVVNKINEVYNIGFHDGKLIGLADSAQYQKCHIVPTLLTADDFREWINNL